MANVVDPNSWRMIPPTDSHPVQPSPPQPERRGAGEGPSSHPADMRSAVAGLSTALSRAFDSPRDEVLWRLPEARLPRETNVANMFRSDAHTRDAWRVIVDRASGVLGGHHFEPAHQPHGSPILLVACDLAESRVDGEKLDNYAAHAADIAAQMQLRYVGPIDGDDATGLAAALEEIKVSGQATLLHVDARRHAVPPPHFTPETADTAIGVRRWRTLAALKLAELARSDERIVAVVSRDDGTLAEAWYDISERLLSVEGDVVHALAWCASLAASGCRPFVFLSSEEVQDHIGQIRRDLCQSRTPVTLVVEAGEANLGSASLSGVYPFAELALVAPRDATELDELLGWCGQHAGPAMVWLCGELSESVFEKRPDEFALGRAEQLSHGSDVALVAWGPIAAAAQLAAEELLQAGLKASVINARFAKPLDRELLVRTAGAAAYVVLVDDAQQSGGFAGWVLEDLLGAGVTQPIAIVAPTEPEGLDHYNRYQRTAAAIVEQCRWLAEPIVPSATGEVGRPTAAAVERSSLRIQWDRFVGRHAQRTNLERAQVFARQLSPDVSRWVKAYEEIGSRDVYLWRWCSHGVELTTLPCVLPELRAHVCDTKMLSIVLCVLMDDVADQHGNSYLLDALLEMTCWGSSQSVPSLNAVERRHADVARALWAEYLERIQSYPTYETFEPVLRFDLLQSFNTMRYSHLVNSRPYLLNMVEHDLYTPHNMMQTSFATLDLMCSPRFPLEEVGTLREAAHHAQCMGRIGNLLSTWRRELANRDFTSGVFARAMMEGDLTLEELAHGNVAELEQRIRERGHEAFFFGQWLQHRDACRALATRIEALDLRAMLEAHDRFFAIYLGSQGLL